MIAKAERLDNEGIVQGYIFFIWEQGFIQWGTTNGVPNQIEIKPETIQYSLDNGTTWNSESKLQELLGYGNLQRSLSTGRVEL